MISKKLTTIEASKLLTSFGCQNNLEKNPKVTPFQTSQLFDYLIFLGKLILGYPPKEQIRELISENVYLIDLNRHELSVILVNEFIIIRPLLELIGSKVQFSDYLNSRAQAVYEALEELIRYKVYKDSIFKQSSMAELGNKIRKSKDHVGRMIKEKSDKEINYLSLQNIKASERSLYNDIMFRKTQTDKRIAILKSEVKDLMNKKAEQERKYREDEYLRNGLSDQLQRMKLNIIQLSKGIVTNPHKTEQALKNIKGQCQRLESILKAQNQQAQKKTKRMSDLYQQLMSSLNQFYTQLQTNTIMKKAGNNLKNRIITEEQNLKEMGVYNQKLHALKISNIQRIKQLKRQIAQLKQQTLDGNAELIKLQEVKQIHLQNQKSYQVLIDKTAIQLQQYKNQREAQLEILTKYKFHIQFKFLYLQAKMNMKSNRKKGKLNRIFEVYHQSNQQYLNKKQKNQKNVIKQQRLKEAYEMMNSPGFHIKKDVSRNRFIPGMDYSVFNKRELSYERSIEKLKNRDEKIAASINSIYGMSFGKSHQEVD